MWQNYKQPSTYTFFTNSLLGIFREVRDTIK